MKYVSTAILLLITPAVPIHGEWPDASLKEIRVAVVNPRWGISVFAGKGRRVSGQQRPLLLLPPVSEPSRIVEGIHANFFSETFFSPSVHPEGDRIVCVRCLDVSFFTDLEGIPYPDRCDVIEIDLDGDMLPSAELESLPAADLGPPSTVEDLKAKFGRKVQDIPDEPA